MTPDTVGAASRSADASAALLDAISRKRSGLALADDQVGRLIADYVAQRVPDYQMAAFLATVACQGMSVAEASALTRAYVDSGDQLRLRDLGRTVLDKHSTGGVGDNVSLVVVPVVAACGIAVVKMSGRGLGYAGGTVDKLESIPGLRLDLGVAEAHRLVREVGMVITGQSPELVPGDQATYALRNVTATVESIPLIAASIISKKVAVGAHGLLLDVKTGAGALVPDLAAAQQLAELMVQLAGAFAIPCRAALTDMSQPLGHAVGNALEVKEALGVLRGEHVPGLSELCRILARMMLQLADPELSDCRADDTVAEAIDGGAAHEQFLSWARAQGADVRCLEQPELLPTAPYRTVVTAERSGWVAEVAPRAIGTAALRVGAGRLVHEAVLDPAAGVVLHRRVGDLVRAGEQLADVHHSSDDADDAVALARSAFTIRDERCAASPVVIGVIADASECTGD